MASLEAAMEDLPEPRIFKQYFAFVSWKWGRIIIVTWWFAMMILGITYGFELLSLTNFEFSPPKHSSAAHAQKEFKRKFHDIAKTKELVVYYKCTNVQCNDENPIYSSSLPLYNMSKALNITLQEYTEEHDHIIDSYTDIYSAEMTCYNNNNNQWTNDCIAQLRKAYISESNSSAIGIIRYNGDATTTESKNMNSYINKKCKDISEDYGNLIVVKFTGETPMIQDMTQASRDDVEKKDVYTIPLALCVLAVVVRTWRTMFIPLICVFGSICTSFSIMRPVAEYGFAVTPFAPSLMMSVTVAMSIDYSLFLLTRFREEVEKQIKNGRRPNQIDMSFAIRQVTRWSGKVVAFSGFILSITYIGLVAYPMTMLQSVGLSTSIAVMCTILINLTCTPALLLMFPDFFKTLGCRLPAVCERGLARFGIYFPSDDFVPLDEKYQTTEGDDDPRNEYERNLLVGSSINAQSSQPIHTSHSLNVNFRSEDEQVAVRTEGKSNVYPFEISPEERKNHCNRCWYECGSYSTLWPYSLIIIIVVYALISPIGWRVFELRKQLDDTLVFPRNSEYLKTYNEVEEDFSPGMLAPWYIIIPDPTYVSGDYNKSVRSWTYVHDTGVIMTTLYNELAAAGYNMSSSVGISAYQGKTFTEKTYYSALKSGIYNSFAANYISKDNSTTYFEMISAFDPYNSDAIEFVSFFRDTLDNLCANAAPSHLSYTCYLTGGSVNEVDLVNTIFSQFPYVLLGIVAVVFCIMGFFFSSAFVPLRLFITIAVPLSLVYGLSILVYQRGALQGLHWSALANTQGLYWLTPVMTVTILIGLALDYDVFLFARVYEYRVHGLPTREAIVRGIYNTGSIITAAGVIMAIAFCGLLFSQITSLNQTGFIMVVAVLVDTFIIRTLLVPAVLSMAKEVNWWPGIKFSNTETPNNPIGNPNIYSPSNEPLQQL